MTRDDIIKMAREAGFNWPDIQTTTIEQRLERFAALVAAAEREACARILDRNAHACTNNLMLADVLKGNAAAIRARGNT